MDTVPTTPNIALDAEGPRKYIRTFEGDKEILKGGGTPDLAPFNKPTPAPSEQLVATPPIEPVQIPVPPPIPAWQPLAQPISMSVLQEPPRPVEDLSEVENPTVLKTYSSDFLERMKATRASTATVLAAEQDSAALPPEEPRQKSSHSGVLYSIAGAVLLIAGGFGAYSAYVQYLSTSEPIVLAPTVTAPIFVDDREQVSGRGSTLSQAIQQSVGRRLTAGTVRLLYLGTATTSTMSVFEALETPAPGVLLRNIDAAQSMAGVVNAGGTQSPFFILSVTSYSVTFAGMLRWEPLMPRDLAKLFPPHSALVPASVATTTVTTVSTSSPQAIPKKSPTTPATTTPLAPASAGIFSDVVVANHDVRVYRDSSGRDVLLYGYWNQTTLVIARDVAAFTEVLKRLATSRTQ